MRKCDDDYDPPFGIAVVIQDCLVLKNLFSSYYLGFVKHDCNKAAQCCAKKKLPNGMSSL